MAHQHEVTFEGFQHRSRDSRSVSTTGFKEDTLCADFDILSAFEYSLHKENRKDWKTTIEVGNTTAATFLTVWIKGNGGNNAISMFSNFKSFVKDTTSVAKKCAELRSVFIFQFPATRGFLKTEEALQTPLPADPHTALSKALTATVRATRTHTESKDILLANAKEMRIEQQQLRHVVTNVISYI